MRASRSTSTCPNAASSSTSRAGSCRSPARAARCAPADRGLYDRRQRRRRQGAGGEEGAGDVPRPRTAQPRKARRAEGLSRDVRRALRARPGDPPGDVQPYPRPDRRCRLPPAGDGAGAAHADPGLLRAANQGHFGLSGQLRALHLADPPLCRPRRPPRARRGLWSGRGRAHQGGCRGDGADRHDDQRARTPRDGGGARHDRPLRRRLPRRTRRRDGCRRGSPACRITASSPPSRGSAATA